MHAGGAGLAGHNLLSLSPFSHFSHIPTEGLRTEMVSQAQPSQQHRSQTPILQNFNTLKRRCAWAPAYVSSEQHLHGVNYNGLDGRSLVLGRKTGGSAHLQRTGGSASGRGPTGGDQRHWGLKKSTETEARSSLATVYACRVYWWSIPGKTWMPTNQIRAMSVRARVFRELYARALQDLGVYKESRVAHRAIRVRVS